MLKPEWDPPACHGYKACKPGFAQINQECCLQNIGSRSQARKGSAPSYYDPNNIHATGREPLRYLLLSLPWLCLLHL